MTGEGSETDEQIAGRAKSGNRRAFDILVSRHKDGLYRFIRRYVGASDDAYDVLQNCFLAAWSGLARYDSNRPFLPWLRTIALNKCRDYGRRVSVRRALLRAFSSESASTTTHESAAFDGDTREKRLARLDFALSRLPGYYKEPLLLTTVSGLSHKETAELLKTTPKAVEMRLYRARRKLVDLMREG